MPRLPFLFITLLLAIAFISTPARVHANGCDDCGCAAPTGSAAPVIIGEAALISVGEANLSYQTRIDTGARVTSLHAYDVTVQDGVEDAKQNVGKQVTFTTSNGESTANVTTTIVDVATVRNSQGTEDRYEVELTVQWQAVAKKVRVNLRDRGHMTYPLLIGRNWLNSTVPPKILVDCDINELAAAAKQKPKAGEADEAENGPK